jgi:outer membrane protein assembly factor BamB
MDRRRYLVSTAALLPAVAGCITGGDTTKDSGSTPTATPEDVPTADDRPTPESPSGDFESIDDEAVWTFEPPDEIQSYALGENVYVETDETLTRISPAGEIEWTVDSPSERYDLSVVGDSIYSTAFDGSVTARDTASGERQWNQKFDTGQLALTEVTEGTVFAHVTNDDPGVFPLFALDAATGAERWRTKTGMVMRSAVSHGRCLTWSTVDGLSAFDVDTGERQWRDDPLSRGYAWSLLTVGDVLCVSIERTVFGYALPEGTKGWELSVPDDVGVVREAPSGSSYPNRIYVADDSDNLLAVETTSGVELWRAGPEGEPAPGYSGLAIGTKSIVHRTGNVLTAYDSVDGARRWAYSTDTYAEPGQPVVATGSIYNPVVRDDGTLAVNVFDLETGRRRWLARIGSGEYPPRPIGVRGGCLLLEAADTIYGVPTDGDGAAAQ